MAQINNPYNGGSAIAGLTNLTKFNPISAAGQGISDLAQMNKRYALADMMANNGGNVTQAMAPTAIHADKQGRDMFGDQQNLQRDDRKLGQGDRRLDMTAEQNAARNALTRRGQNMTAANSAASRKNALKSSFYSLAGKQYENIAKQYQDAKMQESFGGAPVSPELEAQYTRTKGVYDNMMGDLGGMFGGGGGQPSPAGVAGLTTPTQGGNTPTPAQAPVEKLVNPQAQQSPMVIMPDADSGIVSGANGVQPFRADRYGAPENTKTGMTDPERKAAHQARLEKQAAYYGVPVDQVEAMGEKAFNELYAGSYGTDVENVTATGRDTPLTTQQIGNLARTGNTLVPFGQTDKTRVMGPELTVDGTGVMGEFKRELSNIDIGGKPASQVLGELAEPTGNMNMDLKNMEKMDDRLATISDPKQQKKALGYGAQAFRNNPTAIQQLIKGKPTNISREAIKKNPGLYTEAMADLKKLGESYRLDNDPKKLFALRTGAKNLKAYGNKDDEKALDTMINSTTGRKGTHENMLDIEADMKKFPDYDESDDGNYEFGKSPKGDLTNILDMYNDKYASSQFSGMIDTWEDLAQPDVANDLKTAWKKEGLGTFSWDKMVGLFREEQDDTGFLYMNEGVKDKGKFDKFMKAFDAVRKTK